MMLTALYNFAEREGLLRDLDYEPRRIDVVLRLDRTGGLLGVVFTEQGFTLRVPRLETRSSGIAPGFLVDKSQYVLGIADPDAPRPHIANERAQRCNEAYARMVYDACERETDAALKAVAAFQRALSENRSRVLAAEGGAAWSGAENVAFEVDGQWAHESPGARKAWLHIRATSASTLPPARCLVTGQIAPPEYKHPPIKGMPGTQQAQTMLVSFNAPAFTSMHFEQCQNAQISRLGAEGYVTALNYLLRKDPASNRRFAGGIGLGSETVVLVWTKEKAPELASLLHCFDARGPESGIETIKAPLTGLEPSAADATDFFAVTLGGNAARVVVRDWYQSRFGDVKAAVRQWFDDLRVVGQVRAPALWQLIASLEPPGNSGLPPTLATALAHAAFFGGRVPLEVLRHALLRVRVPPARKEGRHVLEQRIALIKIVLVRTHKMEVPVSLDEGKTDVPYLLGRLFAVLERLQGAALGDINASIRDRYFGSASSTPANVFPRLLRLSMHHSSKAGTEWFERLKGQIVAALPAEQFPQILPLEAQGLFAVGYYHQRQKFFEKREVGSAIEGKEADK